MCGHLTELGTSAISSNCWRGKAPLWLALQCAPLFASEAVWHVRVSQIRFVQGSHERRKSHSGSVVRRRF